MVRLPVRRITAGGIALQHASTTRWTPERVTSGSAALSGRMRDSGVYQIDRRKDRMTGKTVSQELAEASASSEPLELRRAAVIASAVGISHAVLLLIAFSIVLRYLPRVDASEAEFREFYAEDGRRRLVLFAGIYLVPFAGIAFIWFTVALRSWLRGTFSRLNRLLADILLVSGIIYVALLFGDGAAISVVSVDPFLGDEQLAIPLARQFPHYGASLFLIFAMRMAAMMVSSLSTIGRSTSVFPKWFIYTGYVVGITLLLTSSIHPFLVAVFPIWLIVFCSFVIRHVRGRMAEPAGPAGPALPS